MVDALLVCCDISGVVPVVVDGDGCLWLPVVYLLIWLTSGVPEVGLLRVDPQLGRKCQERFRCFGFQATFAKRERGEIKIGALPGRKCQGRWFVFRGRNAKVTSGNPEV